MLEKSATHQKILPPNALDHFCESYGIGDLLGCRRAGTGSSKLNMIIETTRGKFFLKDYGSVTSRALANVQCIYQVISHMKSASVPVPDPLLNSASQPWHMAENRLFMLFPLVNGDHLDGLQLNGAQIEHLGALIARLHRVLSTLQYESCNIRTYEQPNSPRTLEFISRFEDLVAPNDPVLEIARPHFALIRQLITQEQSAPVQNVFPIWPIHGDLAPANLLWSGNNVTAILDWDDSLGLSLRVLEIAYLMNWFFWNKSIDWEKIALFMHSYHEELPLTRREITSLVDIYYWYQIHDTWAYSYYVETMDPRALDFAYDNWNHLQWLAKNRTLLRSFLCSTPL